MSYPRALSLHLRMRSAVKARRSEQRRRTWRSSLSACPSIETRRRSERRRTHSYTAAATAIAYPVGFPKSTSCCTRYHPERGPAMPRRHSRIHQNSVRWPMSRPYLNRFVTVANRDAVEFSEWRMPGPLGRLDDTPPGDRLPPKSLRDLSSRQWPRILPSGLLCSNETL